MNRLLCVLTCLWALTSLAEDPPTTSVSHASSAGQTWSAVGARTVEPQANLIEVAAGFPGLSVSYLRGVAPGLNLGARVSFTYGVEGLVRDVIPGVKVQGLVKVRFIDSERVSFGLTFEPGPLFVTPYASQTRAGFALPIGLRLGVAASSAFGLALLVEVPLWIEFGPSGGFNVPILSGIGLEYFVTSKVALFFRTRMGPTIRPWRLAEFTFDAALGVALKF